MARVSRMDAATVGRDVSPCRCLELLANVAAAQVRASELERGNDPRPLRGANIGGADVLRLVERRERSWIAGQRAAALAATQQSGADREWGRARLLVHESAVFDSTNDEVARATGHSPRSAG